MGQVESRQLFQSGWPSLETACLGDAMNQAVDGSAARYRDLDASALRDSLHKALSDLARAEQAALKAQSELDKAREQLKIMRLSRSWRLTAPLRRMKRRATRGDHW